MNKFITIFLILTLFIFTGCSSKKNKAVKNTEVIKTKLLNKKLNNAIIDMSEQLFKNAKVNLLVDKIALTSFVNLHKFSKTNDFGRKISESFFNELHIRGFRIIDLRGTKTIRVNDSGEFFITRSKEKLDEKRVETSYILVGTYSNFGNGVMMNARIIDTESGDVVASARSIVDDVHCSITDSCKPKPKKKPVKKKKVDPNKIKQKRTISISGAKE